MTVIGPDGVPFVPEKPMTPQELGRLQKQSPYFIAESPQELVRLLQGAPSSQAPKPPTDPQDS